ncbi:MAG: hypothetical protein ABL882_12405 [Sphingopyxis sp.]|nr:hypothetical protein [Hyphomicrobium sp.]
MDPQIGRWLDLEQVFSRRTSAERAAARAVEQGVGTDVQIVTVHGREARHDRAE